MADRAATQLRPILVPPRVAPEDGGVVDQRDHHRLVVGRFDHEDMLGEIFGDRRDCVDRGEQFGGFVAPVIREDGRGSASTAARPVAVARS